MYESLHGWDKLAYDLGNTILGLGCFILVMGVLGWLLRRVGNVLGAMFGNGKESLDDEMGRRLEKYDQK